MTPCSHVRQTDNRVSGRPSLSHPTHDPYSFLFCLVGSQLPNQMTETARINTRTPTHMDSHHSLVLSPPPPLLSSLSLFLSSGGSKWSALRSGMQTRHGGHGHGHGSIHSHASQHITHMNQSTDRSIGLEDLKIAHTVISLECAADQRPCQPSVPLSSVSQS